MHPQVSRFGGSKRGTSQEETGWTTEDYVAAMRGSFMASDIEMLALSDCLPINIFVFKRSSGGIFLPVTTFASSYPLEMRVDVAILYSTSNYWFPSLNHVFVTANPYSLHVASFH